MNIEGSKINREHWEKRFEEGYGEGLETSPYLMGFFEKYKDEVGTDILDIGSGEGRHLVPLAKRGFKLTGVEITNAGSRTTRNKLDNENIFAGVVQADFKNLPFKDRTFDTVFSVDAMHHNDWAGATQAFGEAARVLKPGGLFFLRVNSTSRILPEHSHPLEEAEEPEANSGVTFLRDREMKDGSISPQLMHAFSLEELSGLAKGNGLEIADKPVEETKPGQPGHWNIVFRKARNHERHVY